MYERFGLLIDNAWTGAADGRTKPVHSPVSGEIPTDVPDSAGIMRDEPFAPVAPFGGVKESGFGREGGALGIKDYLEAKYIRHRLSIEGARA